MKQSHLNQYFFISMKVRKQKHEGVAFKMQCNISCTSVPSSTCNRFGGKDLLTVSLRTFRRFQQVQYSDYL